MKIHEMIKMNITELEKLAKAALKETAPYVRAMSIDKYRQAANPETILTLIALTREMREALEKSMVFMDTPVEERKVQPWTQVYDALAKYKEMTNGN